MQLWIKHRLFVTFFGVFLLLICPTIASAHQKSVWAKGGTAFPSACPPSTGCNAFRVVSPDGKSAVQVRYVPDSGNPNIKEASILVISSGRVLGTVPPVGQVENEVKWSPDSKAFFMNGSDNAYTENPVAVHYVDDPNLGPGYVTAAVAQDMIRSFPPCRVKKPSEICAAIAANPKDSINAVGIAWVDKSAGIVVMAEVPCTSSMGGIMCQVLGYEIALPSGKIIRRMGAKEFRARWQRDMAWTFRIPEPAEFEKEPKSR